jgi:hypothetical protein
MTLYHRAVEEFLTKWEGQTNASPKLKGFYGTTKAKLHDTGEARGRYGTDEAEIETNEDGYPIANPDDVFGDEVGTYDRNKLGYAEPQPTASGERGGSVAP